MKCKICNKPLKENTDGNNKYCQGHWIGEKVAKKQDNDEVRRDKSR